MNYRIQARQQNFVINAEELAGAWAFLKLPAEKLPTVAALAVGDWYLHLPETDEYVDVTPTSSPAIALDKLINPLSKWALR